MDLIETAIVMARGMAKGLHPVEMGADGLMQALDEFTATTSEMFGIACRFECDSPVLVHAPAVATNLYRIAQEAVSNAIKHGRAKEIVVSLDNSEQGIKLMIADSGCGFPNPLPESQGMGLQDHGEPRKRDRRDVLVEAAAGRRRGDRLHSHTQRGRRSCLTPIHPRQRKCFWSTTIRWCGSR